MWVSNVFYSTHVFYRKDVVGERETERERERETPENSIKENTEESFKKEDVIDQ